jgi:hypothetical protein
MNKDNLWAFGPPLIIVVVALGALASGARDCVRAVNQQATREHAEYKRFVGQCRTDEKTVTECEVLWAQVRCH